MRCLKRETALGISNNVMPFTLITTFLTLKNILEYIYTSYWFSWGQWVCFLICRMGRKNIKIWEYQFLRKRELTRLHTPEGYCEVKKDKTEKEQNKNALQSLLSAFSLEKYWRTQQIISSHMNYSWLTYLI